MNNVTKFEAIKNETNKYGDQIFQIQGTITIDQSTSINKFIRIKGVYGTFIVLCTNQQSAKITDTKSCNINLINDTVYDFSNYPLPLGNINQDNIVNSLDFSIIKNELSHSNEPSCNIKTDLNNDGVVNGVDINLLKLHLFVSDESLNATTSSQSPTPTDTATQNTTPTTPTLTPTTKPTVTPTNKPIPVSSFNLDSNQIITSVGKSRKILISNISPANATQQTATYTSSDNSIATIDSFGTINGISKGQTTISVKIGDISQQTSVDVLPAGDKVFFLKSELNSETPADTIILESNGKYGFVDAGNTTVAKKFLKYLGVSSIDFMLLTH